MPHQQLIDRITIADLIDERSKAFPHKPALFTDDNQSLDYGGLAKIMESLRAGLNAAGLGREDRLAIVHSNNARLAIVLIGVISGSTAVPLDPALTEEEFVREFQNRRVDGLIVTAGSEGAARRAAERLSIPSLDLVWDGPGIDATVTLRGSSKKTSTRNGIASPADCAVVLGTSGTTDRSKVVPLRQRTLLAQIVSTQNAFALTGDDRCLCLNPLFFLSGLQHYLACLCSGGSVIIVSSFDSGRFFESIASLRPTWFLGSFTFLKPIISYTRENPCSIDPGQFRFLRVTFARIEKEHVDAVEKIFHAPVIEGLGLTETGTIAANPLPPMKRKFGTVGRPLGCEIAVIDDQDNFLPARQEGEVVIRGDLVFDGYENDSDANEQAFCADWYRTGDMGFVDEDGYLTLIGRKKEMINRGGMKISPVELDKALRAHPNVLDAAAFGIPHPTLGELPGAAIVWTGDRSPSPQTMLKRFLRKQLAPFKVPVGFLYLDSIPRGPGGKILRWRLGEMFDSTKDASLNA